MSRPVSPLRTPRTQPLDDSARHGDEQRVSGVQLVMPPPSSGAHATQAEARSLASALYRACGVSEAPEAHMWSIPAPRTMFVATGEFEVDGAGAR